MSLVESHVGYKEEIIWCQTQFQERRASLIWKICGFSQYEGYEPGEFITSAEFECDEQKNWCLHLYPKGKTEEKEEFVAVFIHSKAATKNEPITCYISIMDDSGDIVENKKISFRSNDSAGFEDFISRKRLLDTSNLLHPEGDLVLRCDLAIVKKAEESWESGSNRPRSFTRHSDNENTLSRDMGRLLKDDDKLSDVVFNVEVFAAMFQQDMLEAHTNTVAIKDIEVQVFRELLSYVYTNHCSLSGVEFAMQLLGAADRYDIASLKTLCADYLNENLSEENMFHIVACADTFGEKKLLKNCIKFIVPKVSYLNAVDADWKIKLRSNPEVLARILQLLPVKEKSQENVDSSCSVESEPVVCHSEFVTGLLVWKISGFSLCNFEIGESFRSEIFGIRGGEKKWFLKLHPIGENDDSEGFVSVFLFSNKDDVAHMECELSMMDTNSEILQTKHFSVRESFTSGWGWPKYIFREEFLNCILDDELILFCEIKASELIIPLSKECAPTDCKTNSLARDMVRIFDDKEFADIFLQINKAQILAHKSILKSRSSVFAEMIDEDSTKDSLCITDIKEDVFLELLRFIYTDKCTLKNVDFAMDVLAAAHKYAVSGLTAECYEYLYDHMSAYNASRIAIYAFTVRETKLYEDSLDYICQEWPSVKLLVRPMELLHSHPDILQDLLGRFVD